MGTISTLPGTRDILPEEIGYWQYVEAATAKILGRAMYYEIRSPIFENTSLFERGIGEATDVVSKEMYTFSDRSDRSITLRPEGTAGIVRAYLQNNLYALGGVQRLWYSGPMFRYERPQAGRQRQFHQIGLELIGSRGPRADVEVIALATDILKFLGLKKLKLNINSIGDQYDRKLYREALTNYFLSYKDELDIDSQNRLSKNPLRILDSKNEKTKEINKNAPNILNFLGKESQKHFDEVQQLLTDLDIDYHINPCLVRGLDYYTHTAFEIQSDNLGSQSTVCGGGRYDHLIEELGGTSTPAVGWAIGVERLIILLKQIRCSPEHTPDIYIVSKGQKAESIGLYLAQRMRSAELVVELDMSGSNFGKQFKRADRSKAYVCIVIGEEEAKNSTLQLKWLYTKEQSSMTQSDFLHYIEELKKQINQYKKVTSGLT
ncbi:histidine--tRNA ligase [Candidatus Atelocyanobacterium thalassae]|uniref:Histidine--tRNA ligase n=1 Tax=cyanobacterium endosymbiont of Braarudosphaera bigelowii TaxID=1285375 RepID=A0ABM7U6G6_9CHRO|nr:histidine--tRNA ligase [Candidatus Atelocyanobacterium thalassa]BDA40276.1 histidine--tRNA ligase [cyanobacterium endosymbiont of Braarudosphaera bigelowii]